MHRALSVGDVSDLRRYPSGLRMHELRSLSGLLPHFAAGRIYLANSMTDEVNHCLASLRDWPDLAGQR